MIRYTTPTDVLVVKGLDLSSFDVWVSYQQKTRELDVKASSVTFDGTDSTVEVNLTQEQTGLFKKGSIQVQVNWISQDGNRDATFASEEMVVDNLLEKVIDYGDD